MKVLFKDFKLGEVRVKVEGKEDLWYLSRVIKKGDLVWGRSSRKVKKEEGQEGVRRPISVEIKVEKVTLHPNFLKLLGRIEKASQEIGKGYHSLNVSQGDTIRIKKEKWEEHEKRLLRDAERRYERILLVSLDYGAMDMALLSRGMEYLGEFRVSFPPKHDPSYEPVKEKFLKEALKRVEEVAKEKGVKYVLIGCAGFLSDEVKELTDRKVVKISYGGKNGLNEIVRRGYVERLLREDKLSRDMKLVDQLLGEIAKEGRYAYGVEEVRKALEYGAVEVLLITDGFMGRDMGLSDELMRETEKRKGKVTILDSSSEPGRKVDGLGGVAALLRFKV